MTKRKVPDPSPSELLTALSRKLLNVTPEKNKIFGQEKNVEYLLEMFNRTVEKGESNSLLVLGPRGVGKTALVNQALTKAGTVNSWKDNVVVVELSGHIQLDDKLALRDITKQLNLENVVGNKVFGSFAEHLSFLLASLKTGDSSSKPILFILDHFESFCSHKNQTLLYNLFDVAQSRAVPITVLGVSSSIDVTELLEKRVKSRFSHRHLYIWPISDVKIYLSAMELLLTLDGAEFCNWNSYVKSFMSSKPVQKLVEQKMFSVKNSFRHLKQVLFEASVNIIEAGNSQLILEYLETAADCDGLENNGLTDMIRDLSVTEICLLIAIKHLEQIYDNEPFNFEMVYHEYVQSSNGGNTHADGREKRDHQVLGEPPGVGAGVRQDSRSRSRRRSSGAVQPPCWPGPSLGLGPGRGEIPALSHGDAPVASQQSSYSKSLEQLVKYY